MSEPSYVNAACKIIFVGDQHFCDSTPETRVDDYTGSDLQEDEVHPRLRDIERYPERSLDGRPLPQEEAKPKQPLAGRQDHANAVGLETEWNL